MKTFIIVWMDRRWDDTYFSIVLAKSAEDAKTALKYKETYLGVRKIQEIREIISDKSLVVMTIPRHF